MLKEEVVERRVCFPGISESKGEPPRQGETGRFGENGGGGDSDPHPGPPPLSAYAEASADAAGEGEVKGR
jgi:hypothetical protein